MTVYLIEGRTGKYEDRCEWISHVFLSKDAALDKMCELNNFLFSQKAHRSAVKYVDYNRRVEVETLGRSLDPRMVIDSGGAEYEMIEMEMSDE